MPQQAQQFIKQHFADSKVALAKMESDFFYKSYEVIFTNGDKVEFDNKGNWEEVNCKYSSVPTAIIPAAIDCLDNICCVSFSYIQEEKGDN